MAVEVVSLHGKDYVGANLVFALSAESIGRSGETG